MNLTAAQSIGHHAVLFADISGSTGLYESIGDTAARRVVVRVFALLSDAIHRYEGMQVKTIGDEVMCLFNNAESAAKSSLQMQRLMRETASVENDLRKITLRIGFHAGDIIRERNDVFGDAVNTAARVVGQAKGGQILTTKTTLDTLSSELKAASRFVDSVVVRGKRVHLDLYELLWDSAGLTSVEGPYRGSGMASPRKLVLRFQHQEIVLSDEKRSLQVGRDASNDFVVQDTLVSRAHARIEFRKDKFVLVDQSINGTYVLIYGEREECVRRDEMVLRGSGVISPGRMNDDEAGEQIHFSCE